VCVRACVRDCVYTTYFIYLGIEAASVVIEGTKVVNSCEKIHKCIHLSTYLLSVCLSPNIHLSWTNLCTREISSELHNYLDLSVQLFTYIDTHTHTHVCKHAHTHTNARMYS